MTGICFLTTSGLGTSYRRVKGLLSSSGGREYIDDASGIPVGGSFDLSAAIRLARAEGDSWEIGLRETCRAGFFGGMGGLGHGMDGFREAVVGVEAMVGIVEGLVEWSFLSLRTSSWELSWMGWGFGLVGWGKPGEGS